jgi:hypothetical protein
MTIRKSKNAKKLRQRRAGRRRRDCAPPSPRRDFTVDEWCDKRRISRFLFYEMLRDGTAPRTMKIRKRRTISPEADEEWQREREAATATA